MQLLLYPDTDYPHDNAHFVYANHAAESGQLSGAVVITDQLQVIRQ